MSSIASGPPPVRPFVNVSAISANDSPNKNDAQSPTATSDDDKAQTTSSNAKSAIAPTHTDHVNAAPASDASASADFSKRGATPDASSRGQDQDAAADRSPREWQQPASTNAPSLRNGAPGTVLNLLA